MSDTELREEVRARYGEAASAVLTGTGVACDCSHPGRRVPRKDIGSARSCTRHSKARRFLKAPSSRASGCGNPTAVADLHPGETVLDLGSGGGIDVLLSAKRVGPTGKVYGLDMTEEMLALAIRNRDEAGVTNVEFLKGYIEDVPLPANTVDVIISTAS